MSMHAVTGAFADPTHESAFAAQLFRLAFPLHVLLLALCLAIVTFMAFDVAVAMQPQWLVIGFVGLLGLVSTPHLTREPCRALRASYPYP